MSSHTKSNMRPPILVVDADPDKRERLCRVLALDGHEVVSADGVASAVVASQQHRPGLVVLDAVHPGSDGESLLRALRTAMNGSTPPAFLLTTSESEVRSARSLGAVMGFCKPFAVEDLLLAVQRFLAECATLAC